MDKQKVRINRKVPKDQELLRFWGRVDIDISLDVCWEWKGRKNSDGYGEFDYNNTCTFAHRYSWMTLHGEIPKGMVICHKCDNPPCCNPNHLFMGTVQDNVRDRDAKGRQADRHGKKNGRAVLDEEKVRAIKLLRKNGATYKELQQEFGVSNGCINHIVNGRHWVWIK